MKKGFTLIEIIVVLVILASLTLIVVPTVKTIINNSKAKSHDLVVITIEDAAKAYFYENFSIYESDLLTNSYVDITIDVLKYNDYLDSNCIDPVTEQPFEGFVRITKPSGAYEYEFIPN